MIIKTHSDYQAQDRFRILKKMGETDVSPFGAFRRGEKVKLVLSVPAKSGAYAFTMILTDADTDTQIEKRLFTIENWGNKEDVYTCPLPTEKEALYFYQIEYKDDKGIHFVTNPLTQDEAFQLTIYDKDYSAPTMLRGGIIYHIFVDRFCRSGRCAPKPYAVMNNDPEGVPQFAQRPGAPLANNMFFGGDLYGIIEKLDYLQTLGVNCLYLSPIFDARSNHKYDTGNYMEVDQMFGGNKALEALIAEADKRNMYVVLDGVFNHTGDDSYYFNKYGHYDSIGAYQSQASDFYDWYKFSHFPDRYDSWWGIDILPATNKNCPSFQNFVNGEKGVVAHYLKKGIAGWRLDVADELPDEFLVQLASRAKEVNQEAIIIGEVWEDASHKIAYSKRRHYFRGHELDSVTNYPLRSAIIAFVMNADGEAFRRRVMCLYEHYPKCVSDNLMNILGTHDTERILTVLGGEGADGLTNQQLAFKKLSMENRRMALQRLKLAYTLCATLPGIPCIYYGDEAGLEGYRDPFNRRFFPWGKEEGDLVAFYQKIGRIRRQESAFKDGVLSFLSTGEDYVVYQRNEIIIAVNRGPKEYLFDADQSYINLLTGRTEAINLPPMQAAVYKPIL